MLSKDLVAASTRPLILSILSRSESYGYEIIQQVRALSGGEVEWKEGMLYPVLHRLQKEGLIEAEWRIAENGRKRKYYYIKQEGTKALRVERKQWGIVHSILQKLWEKQPCLT